MIVEATLWDEPWFAPLSVPAKCFWVWARTTDMAAVPGILRGGVSAFAEGMHVEVAEVMAMLRELLDRGLVELDNNVRLLRLDDVPYPPPNQNVVKGWFRKWRHLPDCPLKYRHIPALRASVGGRWGKIWATTFGTVEVPDFTATEGGELSLFQGLGNGIETVSKRYRNGWKNPNETVSSEKVKDVGVVDTVSIPSRNGIETVGSGPGSGSGSRERGNGFDTVSKRFEKPYELWCLQEQLRQKCGLIPMDPTDADLERVQAILEDHDEGDVRRALRVFARDVERDGDKARFFDGRVNWSPGAFGTALRMAPPDNGNGTQRVGVDAAEHRRKLAEDALDPGALAAEWARVSGEDGDETP